MMRSSPYLRQAFYREVAGHLRRLGYEPYEMTTTDFPIRGVNISESTSRQRAREVKALAEIIIAKSLSFCP